MKILAKAASLSLSFFLVFGQPAFSRPNWLTPVEENGNEGLISMDDMNAEASGATFGYTTPTPEAIKAHAAQQALKTDGKERMDKADGGERLEGAERYALASGQAPVGMRMGEVVNGKVELRNKQTQVAEVQFGQIPNEKKQTVHVTSENLFNQAVGGAHHLKKGNDGKLQRYALAELIKKGDVSPQLLQKALSGDGQAADTIKKAVDNKVASFEGGTSTRTLEKAPTPKKSAPTKPLPNDGARGVAAIPIDAARGAQASGVDARNLIASGRAAGAAPVQPNAGGNPYASGHNNPYSAPTGNNGSRRGAFDQYLYPNGGSNGATGSNTPQPQTASPAIRNPLAAATIGRMPQAEQTEARAIVANVPAGQQAAAARALTNPEVGQAIRQIPQAQQGPALAAIAGVKPELQTSAARSMTDQNTRAAVLAEQNPSSALQSRVEQSQTRIAATPPVASAAPQQQASQQPAGPQPVSDTSPFIGKLTELGVNKSQIDSFVSQGANLEQLANDIATLNEVGFTFNGAGRQDLKDKSVHAIRVTAAAVENLKGAQLKVEDIKSMSPNNIVEAGGKLAQSKGFATSLVATLPEPSWPGNFFNAMRATKVAGHVVVPLHNPNIDTLKPRNRANTQEVQMKTKINEEECGNAYLVQRQDGRNFLVMKEVDYDKGVHQGSTWFFDGAVRRDGFILMDLQGNRLFQIKENYWNKLLFADTL